MVLGLKLTFSSSSVSSVLGSRRSLTLLVLAKGRLLGPLSSGIGPSASRARSCREKGAGLAEKRGVSKEGLREERERFSMKYQLAFKTFEQHQTFVRRLDDELNQNGNSEKKIPDLLDLPRFTSCTGHEGRLGGCPSEYIVK